MSAVAAEAWRPALQEELPLNQLSDYPLLDACHRHWRDAGAEGNLPARLDPIELPRQVLPGILLLDIETAPFRLRVRLAGTALCDRHGGELRGRTPEEFLDPDDACLLRDSVLAVIRTGHPSLAKRSAVPLGEWLWSYARLILPLSRQGGAVDCLCVVVDPSTIRRHP